MCTLSWIHHADGYDLLCNRDEQRSRAEAEPPAMHAGPRGRYLSPRDPDGGGSWISVNEHGVALCLLNHYCADATVPRAAANTHSRGRIITALADVERMDAVRHGLDDLALADYRPFLLLALAPDAAPGLWCWNGERLHEEAVPSPPLTTSSVDADAVRASRRQSFRALSGDGPDAPAPSLEQLFRWHRSMRPEAPHAGVAMTRDDAMTVSLSHVRVGPAGIALHYYPGHPARMDGFMTIGEPAEREPHPRPHHVLQRPHAAAESPVTLRLPGVTRTGLPGDQPPANVSPATFDLRTLFRERNPRLAARIPDAGFALLERLAHQGDINRGLYALRDTPCRQFPARVLEYLGVNCEVHGPGPPAAARRPIFAANHPLGAIDGLALLAWLLGRYREVRAPVNDVLAETPHLAPFITPIDKYRRQREASARLHSTFAGDAAVLVFPAGRTSRYVNRQLRDGPWEKLPVRMALAHDRPVVPLFIDARLSRRFYALSRARRMLGIGLNLEMLLLVDEMLRPATPHLNVTVGHSLAPEQLRTLGASDHERAARLRSQCYDLEPKSPGRTTLEASPS